MVILSHYKRGCDRCGKEVDVTVVIVIKKPTGNKHLCRMCAAHLLMPIKILPTKNKNKQLQIEIKRNRSGYA
jgi:hypothetical protein